MYKRFFTNISHELRTPLTLIAGPVEQVLKNDKLPADAREQLVVVERNTNRMLRLVNQILDFRKIQNKKMKMQVQQLNVVAFVRKIMDNFESVAEEHNIDFLFQTEKEALNLWVDADKFEKIVFNLLSNAFKYTPNGKMITVFIREDEGTVSVGVQDQGIGIAENKRKSLFVRFENLVDKNIFNQASSGIGLSLVKELVEMHKATISVDSRLGEGSCFKVDFLKGKEHYNSSVEFILEDSVAPLSMERIVDIANSSLQTEAAIADAPDLEVSTVKEEAEESSSKELMLLVEDNQELRSFLRSIFASTYRVVEASDGMEGWSKALKYLPDIIISDVLMPRLDGITLTDILKANERTAHIPIIHISAKNSIEDQINAYKHGTDLYIPKPFHPRHVLSAVENMINKYSLMKEYFKSSRSSLIVRDGITMHKEDELLLDKIIKFIEDNIDDESMNPDSLADFIGVSKAGLYRKLKELTEKTPSEFVRTIRLEYAAGLLKTTKLTVTEIMYKSGFSNKSYFYREFAKLYNTSPKEYRSGQTEEKDT